MPDSIKSFLTIKWHNQHMNYNSSIEFHLINNRLRVFILSNLVSFGISWVSWVYRVVECRDNRKIKYKRSRWLRDWQWQRRWRHGWESRQKRELRALWLGILRGSWELRVLTTVSRSWVHVAGLVVDEREEKWLNQRESESVRMLCDVNIDTQPYVM